MAVHNCKLSQNTRKFYSRVVYASKEYNGNSANWKHDWLKINQKSYADLNKYVNIHKSIWVDNYLRKG